jgi:pyridoxine 5-phosphate synthase
MEKTRLSVNLNKVALIRNARGGNLPDLLKVAADCEDFGADGITVHPRPDERHIRYRDVYQLREVVRTEFNIEGYPSGRFMDMVLEVRPDQCTLVPDPPGVLTSDAGWDTGANQAFLAEVVGRLKEAGIRVSLFLEPDPGMVAPAASTGADRIELYTCHYAAQYRADREKGVSPFVETARAALGCGLGVNAGHDLNLENLAFFAGRVPGLLEVSIGHALVSDALYYGLQNTIGMYQRLLE